MATTKKKNAKPKRAAKPAAKPAAKRKRAAAAKPAGPGAAVAGLGVQLGDVLAALGGKPDAAGGWRVMIAGGGWIRLEVQPDGALLVNGSICSVTDGDGDRVRLADSSPAQALAVLVGYAGQSAAAEATVAADKLRAADKRRGQREIDRLRGELRAAQGATLADLSRWQAEISAVLAGLAAPAADSPPVLLQRVAGVAVELAEAAAHAAGVGDDDCCPGCGADDGDCYC